ncbi:MAG: AAA family ATPase [Atopobiaceae bacterium]|nr:AAA family ATPase [Atopobiaceae bacterium]
MTRTINIGAQGFEDIRTGGDFYVDKTGFVRDWWFARDQVTLICRPRRFGKTLNLDTVRCFLSTEYAGRGEELFGGLDVWDGGTEAQRKAMRMLQGTVPVVAMSFARVKGATFSETFDGLRRVIRGAVDTHGYLRKSPVLTDGDRAFLARVSDDMPVAVAADAINQLCSMLAAHWGTKPVVMLDEYDSPMERAWTAGYWDDASDFLRQFMNATFKTSPALGRGLITGVTRVSRESIFSDLNNLSVVTTSTPAYQTCFGFTQEEVDAALLEYGLSGKREDVRDWYDGFVFDGHAHIYNPWSVTQFLKSGGFFDAYWANTSGNGLVGDVVRCGDKRLKSDFETLLRGGEIQKVIDEQVVVSELRTRPNAVWALLLAAGYVTSPGPVPEFVAIEPRRLRLTNREVAHAFDRMAEGWFSEAEDDWDDFAQALFAGDAEAATDYLAEITLYCMSSFDGTNRSAESEPERFYHGLVLGMLASLRGRWSVESNRESGRGRYDVALVPTDGAAGIDPAVVIEFKVFDPRREKTLEDTVVRARAQIEERSYVSGLVSRGIAHGRIRTYGIAFRGKEVLVG